MKKAKWIGGCVLIVAMTLVLWPFCFGYTAICTKCGAEEHVREWRVPFCDLTFFRYSSIVETPLSSSLAPSGLVAEHSHNWLFAAGGGNGVTCAIGSGRYLWNITRQPNSGRLLEAIQTYDGPDKARRLLDFALNPEYSQNDILSMVKLFPTNGFSNKEQFHTWLSDNDLNLEQALSGTKRSL